LKGDAQLAATQGVAGSLASASAVNYATRSAKSTNGNPVANCIDVATALQGGLPPLYAITSLVVAPGAAETCTLSNGATPATTATFTAIGIS
jgi:MSHA pilin protein MshA